MDKGTLYLDHGGYPAGLILNYGGKTYSQTHPGAKTLSQGTQSMSWFMTRDDLKKQGARLAADEFAQGSKVSNAALQRMDRGTSLDEIGVRTAYKS